MQSLNNNIVDLLETQLRPFQENILDILELYTDFESLDMSTMPDAAFKFVGKQGVEFIDGLRGFFHLKKIEYETALWIINRWGGIGSFKDNDRNKARIDKLQIALPKRVFTKESFSVVSSLSKVASFMNHEEYFVYDSRVIYSLNWLILKAKLKEPQFFPMPEGRGTKLTMFDLQTIINLYYKDNILDKEWKSKTFIDPKHAYFVYCDLIKKLSKRIFPAYKAYYLEMLLFVIADRQIFDELKSTVQLSIR